MGVSGRGGDHGSNHRRSKLAQSAGRSSRYRGVYWEPKGSKWYSSISFNHKVLLLACVRQRYACGLSAPSLYILDLVKIPHQTDQ